MAGLLGVGAVRRGCGDGGAEGVEADGLVRSCLSGGEGMEAGVSRWGRRWWIGLFGWDRRGLGAGVERRESGGDGLWRVRGGGGDDVAAGDDATA